MMYIKTIGSEILTPEYPYGFNFGYYLYPICSNDKEKHINDISNIDEWLYELNGNRKNRSTRYVLYKPNYINRFVYFKDKEDAILFRLTWA